MMAGRRPISSPAVWLGLLGVPLALLGACSRPGTEQAPARGSATAAVSTPASQAPQVQLPQLPRAEILSFAAAEALLANSKPLALAVQSLGALPRQGLRYPWKSAVAVQLTVETVVAVSVERAGARDRHTPKRLRVQLQVQAEAAADDTVWIELRVLGPGEEGPGEEGPAEVGPAEGGAGGVASTEVLAGVRSRRRFDAQGVPLGTWSTPEGIGTDGMQLWASVAEAVADAVVPLPAAALGEGARWQTLERMRRAGATWLRATSYQLHFEADGALRIQGRYREVAIAGRAGGPALPAELTVEVRGGVATGSHQLTRPIADWFARESSGELAGDLSLLISAGGGAGGPTGVEITQLSSLTRRTDQ